MIVEVILVHNSNIKNNKIKKEKNAAPTSMHDEGPRYPQPAPPPTPCSSSAPRDLLGENGFKYQRP